MTNKEAIEIITNAVQTDSMTAEQDLALSLVQKAVEKQTLKKFKQVEPVSVKAFDGIDRFLIMHALPCPCCDRWIVVNKSKRFCEYCGNALDWSDTK